MSVNSRLEWEKKQYNAAWKNQLTKDDREVERNRVTSRVDARRLVKRMQIERVEAEKEERVVRLKEAEKIAAEANEQESLFTEEVNRIRTDELRDSKLRQKLRRDSHELRELERKLKEAYSMKLLDAQLREKEQTVIREKKFELIIGEKIHGSIKDQEAEEKIRYCEDYKKKLQYRSELQQQLIETEMKRQQRQEELLIDKRLRYETVKRVDEEDYAEDLAKKEKILQTQREIEDFKTAQLVWRDKEKRRIDAENQKIAADVKNEDEAKEKMKKEAQEKADEKDRFSQKIALEIFEAEKIKQDKIDIVHELAHEESLAAQESQIKADFMKELRHREEMRRVQAQQLAERRAKHDREVKEAAAYRDVLIKKMAEDARFEQLSREKQRLKMVQFRKEIDEAMEHRKVLQAEEAQKLIRLEEVELLRERDRLRAVEDERLRMLQEHAPKLFGFLPRGVLKESDFGFLGPEFGNLYYGGKGDTCQN